MLTCVSLVIIVASLFDDWSSSDLAAECKRLRIDTRGFIERDEYVIAFEEYYNYNDWTVRDLVAECERLDINTSALLEKDDFIKTLSNEFHKVRAYHHKTEDESVANSADSVRGESGADPTVDAIEVIHTVDDIEVIIGVIIANAGQVGDHLPQSSLEEITNLNRILQANPSSAENPRLVLAIAVMCRSNHFATMNLACHMLKQIKERSIESLSNPFVNIVLENQPEG